MIKCSNRLSSIGTMKFEAGASRTRLWSANHQTVTFCTVKYRWHFLKFIELNDSNKTSERSTFKVLYYRITVAFFLYLLSLYHVHFTKDMKIQTPRQEHLRWANDEKSGWSLRSNLCRGFRFHFLSLLPAFVSQKVVRLHAIILCLFQILCNSNASFILL